MTVACFADIQTQKTVIFGCLEIMSSMPLQETFSAFLSFDFEVCEKMKKTELHKNPCISEEMTPYLTAKLVLYQLQFNMRKHVQNLSAKMHSAVVSLWVLRLKALEPRESPSLHPAFLAVEECVVLFCT